MRLGSVDAGFSVFHTPYLRLYPNFFTMLETLLQSIECYGKGYSHSLLLQLMKNLIQSACTSFCSFLKVLADSMRCTL